MVTRFEVQNQALMRDIEKSLERIAKSLENIVAILGMIQGQQQPSEPDWPIPVEEGD